VNMERTCISLLFSYCMFVCFIYFIFLFYLVFLFYFVCLLYVSGIQL